MEALQLAQMLADLNDLQATQDQSASKDLLSANRALDRKSQLRLEHEPRSLSVPVAENRMNSPAGRMTDKFGRRMLTPPLTRTNSASPSMPGSPSGHERPDADIDRASTLLSLYEIRAKLREQDNSGLMKAREKINALAAKQQVQVTEQHKNDRRAANRLSYPK
ncbi:uncharacterized protein F4807DRAFT_134105 [Annulohypoxylon truncatum]|uniref:uncharacterized protein n=1 Tax=Annulohypoxylon truncatum TaxID=327061 RepID=UPI0020079406|nr:uncharacterized protein F4807DRAFT_134105 [Annulohypoxylon truncatum]KAI1208788.1 hypothetical protein F4807DRAFT_134105 [Annulohypoxylon truncatum]